MLDPEPLTSCKDCERQFHCICVRHMDEIAPEGYICDACLKARGVKRRENKFSARSEYLTSSSPFPSSFSRAQSNLGICLVSRVTSVQAV